MVWGRTPGGFGDNPVSSSPSTPSVGEEQEPNRSQVAAWADPRRPSRLDGSLPPTNEAGEDQSVWNPDPRTGQLNRAALEHNARLFGHPIRSLYKGKGVKNEEEEEGWMAGTPQPEPAPESEQQDGPSGGQVARAAFSLFTGGPLGFLGAMLGMMGKAKPGAKGVVGQIVEEVQETAALKSAVNKELGFFTTREVDPTDTEGMAALSIRNHYQAVEDANERAFGGPPDGPTATGIPDFPTSPVTVPGAAATPEEESTPVDDAINRPPPTFTASTDWLEELRRANEAVSRRTTRLV